MRALFYAGLLALVGYPAVGQTVQDSLGIPPTIATVTDASMPGGKELPEFILIQDLHEHNEAQGAITSILLYGRRSWNTKTVFVEGAQGILERSSLNSQNSGAERAVLMDRDQALSLVGIEDWDLYRANLVAYDQTRQLQPMALEELKTIRLLGRTFDVKSRDTLWQRVEQMIRLELRPQDYAQGIAMPKLLKSPSLARAAQAASLFYDLADERSRIFLKKANAVTVSGPKILVIGGFHTLRMTELLRQEGKTFAVLTPRITQAGDDARYARRMQESLSALRLSEVSH